MTVTRDMVERIGVSGMTPAEASLRGRIGAYMLHATHDARETTAAARTTFLSRFEREVDPGHKLPEAERLRRAEYARRAYFARLALRSAQARSKAAKRATAAKKGTPPEAGPLTAAGR